MDLGMDGPTVCETCLRFYAYIGMLSNCHTVLGKEFTWLKGLHITTTVHQMVIYIYLDYFSCQLQCFHSMYFAVKIIS